MTRDISGGDELEGRLLRLSDPVGQATVATADDVRRGHRALRRRRIVQVGAGLAAVAVIGAGTTWVVNREDPQPASRLEKITWESLLPGAHNPVFPGSPPLRLSPDANSLPILREVINELDPRGEHVGPPESGFGPEDGSVGGAPRATTVLFDWDGNGDVEFTLSRSMRVAQGHTTQRCRADCREKSVGGHRVRVAPDGIDLWFFEQEDGEVVTFSPARLPSGLSAEDLLDAVDDVDLPEENLSPAPPTDPMEQVARTIGEDHLTAEGLGLDVGRHRSFFAEPWPAWEDGQLVNVDYAHGETAAKLGREGRRPALVSWGYDKSSSIVLEDDSDCDPEDYTTCGDRLVHGKTVHLMWEYAEEGASLVVRYDGSQRRAWVRVPYTGRAGTGTPVVPLDTLAALVTDPRWQR